MVYVSNKFEGFNCQFIIDNFTTDTKIENTGNKQLFSPLVNL